MLLLSRVSGDRETHPLTAVGVSFLKNVTSAYKINNVSALNPAVNRRPGVGPVKSIASKSCSQIRYTGLSLNHRGNW